MKPAPATRSFVGSGVSLPTLTLGTMRLAPEGDRSDGTRLLLETLLAEPSVALHSSDEYDSFLHLCSTLGRLPKVELQRIHHIVKLAEPSFDVFAFDEHRLRSRIENYLRQLHTERIDVVQWMVRGDLNDPAGRLQLIRDILPAVGECFMRLQREGLVRAVAFFPYTAEEIPLLAQAHWCDGFAIYMNLGEREWIEAVDLSVRPDQAVLAIRPLGAGQAIDAMRATLSKGADGMDDLSPAEACVRLPLLHPRVLTSIVSASTPAHLDGARRAARVRPDRLTYDRLMQAAEA